MAAQRVTGEGVTTRLARQAGFTLIEVMVAILLTALGVIGMVALFRVQTQSSQFSRRETEAATLAQDKLEELRTQIAPAGATTGAESSLDSQGLSGGLYNRSWDITPSNDAFLITVTVSWTDDDGSTRSVVVRAQRGAT